MAFSWNPFNRWFSSSGSSDPRAVSNDSYGVFSQLNSEVWRAVSAKSVVDQSLQKQSTYLANPTWQSLQRDGQIMMPVATSKPERIAQYRTMAKFTQTQWCLDEIADDFIRADERGNIVNLFLPDDSDPRLNKTRRAILQNEFRKYMSLFDLENEGHNLIKRFLVEGELAWENVISKDYLQRGIVGVRFIPAEYYETLVDVGTNRPVGLLFDAQKMSRDVNELLSNNYIGNAQVFNAISPNTFSFSFDPNTCVPLLWPQVTYINSGDYAQDGQSYVNYPLVEKAKQAYYQLTLLQDAAVILRVTRAPERLLFNVSTGKMTQNYADEYVRNFANSLKAKKVAAADGRDIQQTYNPVSMLENYIFGKSDGNDGTTVESVTSTAQYDQIEDIKFFFKLFVKQFKVPFSRFEQPENAKPADNQIPQEEFSFLQQEVRFQRRFAAGFKKGFITHLKLRDIWDKYELLDSDIRVEFVKPALFDLYNNLQIAETKMNTYKTLADNDEFSKTLVMKKILGWTDAEIEENFALLAKEKCMTQISEYWSGKLDSEGPAGKYATPPIPIKGYENVQVAKAAEGGGDGEGGDEGGGEGGGEQAPDESTETEQPEPKEAPAPTFGLG